MIRDFSNRARQRENQLREISMQKTPMTTQGAEKLRNELSTLKSKDRPEIINAIAEARAHGDLKENAEYHAAREKQSFLEGRIANIEAKLSNCQIIDVTAIENTGKVIFGTTVTIVNIDSDEELKYQIVGEDEADIKLNKISVTSPIARALIGKHIDHEVTVNTPAGESHFEIIQVEHI